jgi:hypothetical protein
MGDHANVVIRSDYRGGNSAPEVGTHEAVFLYGHWSGCDLPEDLRGALARSSGRWNDAQYLARIVFDRAMRRDLDGETGFGITTRLGDNEYDLLVLLPEQQRLVRLPEAAYRERGFAALDDHKSISFAEFIAAPVRTWDNLTDPVA